MYGKTLPVVVQAAIMDIVDRKESKDPQTDHVRVLSSFTKEVSVQTPPATIQFLHQREAIEKVTANKQKMIDTPWFRLFQNPIQGENSPRGRGILQRA